MHIPTLIQFLAELHENNNRPWFAHNKPRYDILREEFEVLVTEVGIDVRKFDKTLMPFEAKKAIYRIYRDVRFSKNKDPYKSTFSAVIGVRNRTDRTQPMNYFQIDHEGNVLTASGIYLPDPAVSKKLRDSVVNNPKALSKVLKNKKFADTFGDLSDHERMMRPPKGYASDLPHIEYIKNRHFFCETTFSVKKRVPKDLANEIANRFEAAQPLTNWIRDMLSEVK
jgi:uncharacterized protein (TIGR02453 family)